MFGWEFPPVISGGLGVACLGLCKALSPLTQLKMIIPKSAPGFNIAGIELIGLNSFSREQLREIFSSEEESYHTFGKVKHVPANFFPYENAHDNQLYITQRLHQTLHEDIEPFDIEDLYAGDVMKKIFEFARISVRYGLQQDFDIIHAHDWMTFLPAMELKEQTGKPLVIHIHSLEYDRAGEDVRNWVWDLEQKAMQMADRVIPVSRYTGQICIEHYGIDPDKIRPVHNGIEAVRNIVHHKAFDEKVVIFFGRVTMQKGPEYFVEAARLVLEYYPDAKFVMAGSGNLLRPMIELTAKYGLGDKFFFTGFLGRKHLNELLAIADVYCMPSVSEPFGLSAVEAVQYGIPTIISKTSGVSEVLGGSLKIDFWDTHKLAQYIIAALDNEGLTKEVVDKNFQNLEHITWHRTAVKVVEVYEELLP